MINAHTRTLAATGAPARSAVVRLARRGVLACALLVAGIGAAQAQHGRGQYRDDQLVQQQVQPDPRGERFQPMPREGESGREQPRFDPRSFDSREFDDVRRRRQQQQQQQMQQEQNARNAEAVRRSRMTPDERRDLRRQINEAGMDLYPNPPRH
jgi:hypothetical protein